MHIKHKFFFCLLLPLLVIFSGCSTNFKYPTNRFSTPENREGGNISTEVIWTGAWKTRLTDDLSVEVLRPYTSNTEPSSTIEWLSTFAFFDLFNLEIDYIHDGPMMFMGKLQFLGDPAPAGAGNFSMAARMGWGHAIAGEEVPKEDIHTGVKQQKVYTKTGTWMNYELLLGIRLWNPFLLYAGGFYNTFSTKLMTDKGTTEQMIDGGGVQLGGHVGFELTFAFLSWKTNVSWSKISDDRDGIYENPREDLFYGTSLAFNF